LLLSNFIFITSKVFYFYKDFGVKEKENVKQNNRKCKAFSVFQKPMVFENCVIDFCAESRKSLFGSFAYSLFQN